MFRVGKRPHHCYRIFLIGLLYNGRHMSPSKMPFPWGSRPHLWIHMSQVIDKNGISIGTAVFAQLTCVQPNTDRQTNKQTRTDHTTCNICSNRPHLRSAGRLCYLKIQMHPRSQQMLNFSFGSVLLSSRPRSEGWPLHGRTFSINLCPLSL